jgi:hypothetical protein
LSASRVRPIPNDQQTLHACAPSWPQRCRGNICKRNIFCGYASYHASHIGIFLLQGVQRIHQHATHITKWAARPINRVKPQRKIGQNTT